MLAVRKNAIKKKHISSYYNDKIHEKLAKPSSKRIMNSFRISSMLMIHKI